MILIILANYVDEDVDTVDEHYIFFSEKRSTYRPIRHIEMPFYRKSRFRRQTSSSQIHARIYVGSTQHEDPISYYFGWANPLCWSSILFVNPHSSLLILILPSRLIFNLLCWSSLLFVDPHSSLLPHPLLWASIVSVNPHSSLLILNLLWWSSLLFVDP